jgi:hypothetical protein
LKRIRQALSDIKIEEATLSPKIKFKCWEVDCSTSLTLPTSWLLVTWERNSSYPA